MLQDEEDLQKSVLEQAQSNPDTAKAAEEWQREKLLAKAREKRLAVQAQLVKHGYVLGTSHTKEGMANLIRASHEISEEMRNDGHGK